MWIYWTILLAVIAASIQDASQDGNYGWFLTGIVGFLGAVLAWVAGLVGGKT